MTLVVIVPRTIQKEPPQQQKGDVMPILSHLGRRMKDVSAVCLDEAFEFLKKANFIC